MSTACPAARTPGRHAGPERQLAVVEGQHLQLRAATLVDRLDAMTAGVISGGGPCCVADLAAELLDWSRDAIDVLREVAR